MPDIALGLMLPVKTPQRNLPAVVANSSSAEKFSSDAVLVRREIAERKLGSRLPLGDGEVTVSSAASPCREAVDVGRCHRSSLSVWHTASSFDQLQSGKLYGQRTMKSFAQAAAIYGICCFWPQPHRRNGSLICAECFWVVGITKVPTSTHYPGPRDGFIVEVCTPTTRTDSGSDCLLCIFSRTDCSGGAVMRRRQTGYTAPASSEAQL